MTGRASTPARTGAHNRRLTARERPRIGSFFPHHPTTNPEKCEDSIALAIAAIYGMLRPVNDLVDG